MATENSTTEVEETEETTESVEETEETTEVPDPTEETEDDTETPEVKKLRREAANYRTQLREAQAKLADAKLPDEVQALVQAELAPLQLELDKIDVLRKANLPDPLPKAAQELFRGTTREELEASAIAISELLGAGRGRGNPGPDDGPDTQATTGDVKSNVRAVRTANRPF